VSASPTFRLYDHSLLILNLIFARRNYGPGIGTSFSAKQHTMEFSPLYSRIKRCTPTALVQQCLFAWQRRHGIPSTNRETSTSTSLNPQTTMTFSARRKEEVKRTYNYSLLAMPRASLWKMNYLFHTELAQPHQPIVKATDQFKHFCKTVINRFALKNVIIQPLKINCYVHNITNFDNIN